MLAAVIPYDSVFSSMQVPPGIDLFQKKLTGLQLKMMANIREIHHPIMMIPVMMEMMVNFLTGKIRR